MTALKGQYFKNCELAKEGSILNDIFWLREKCSLGQKHRNEKHKNVPFTFTFANF
jgi:hypothetical protein